VSGSEEDNSNTTGKKTDCRILFGVFFYAHTQHPLSEKNTSLKNVNQRKKQHDLHAER